MHFKRSKLMDLGPFGLDQTAFGEDHWSLLNSVQKREKEIVNSLVNGPVMDSLK